MVLIIRLNSRSVSKYPYPKRDHPKPVTSIPAVFVI